MNIDMRTIALILVISSVFQGIIIIFQASVNRKYQGINIFGIGYYLCALGFLFIILQTIISNSFITIILGNSLLILALIFQYAGLMRFLKIKVAKWIALSVFMITFFLLTYFNYINNNITYRIFSVSISVSLISFLIASSILKNKITSLVASTKLLAGTFFLVGAFSVLRAFFALFSKPLTYALYPDMLQLLSFSGLFILNFITAFILIFMINKRLNSEILEAKEHFEQIFSLGPDASILTRFSDRIIINCNLGFMKLSGYSKEELLNKSILDLNIYNDLSDSRKIIKALSENKSIRNYGLNFRRKNNNIVICTFSGEMIMLNDTPHIIGIIHDMTDRENAEKELKLSEEKYRLLTEFASDVTWLFNITKNKFTYISPSILQLIGITSEEAIKTSLESFVTPESSITMRECLKNDLENFIANPENSNPALIEIQQPCRNGNIIWVELSTKYRYNSDGDIEIVGVSRDIEKRKRAEKEVLYLSYHDQLTGLYNRRFYEEELQRLDTERNLPIALIMADVNGLKLINDAYGHQAGDMILKSFANILKEECRNDEIVSRTGGDEFVVLLPRTNKEDAKLIIERLYDSISNTNIQNTILSVSMGLSVKCDVSEKMTEIYKKAEDAMYAHKLSVSPNIKKATIDSIVNLLYKRDKQEMLESEFVGGLCAAIAREMNFSPDAINHIKIAGLRHDIGEIAIGDSIRHKAENLNVNEWSEIKRHPEIGYHILHSVTETAEAAKYVLEHHERWDGTGYPKGLKGEEISVQGRIIAIADAYSAMTSDRLFHKALSQEEAIDEIKKCSGTQFDSDIAKIFIEKVLKKEW
ncbi:diguanylate cyclase [Acetobacterium paludosum]|uniref:Diguanylate cyclase n=1 Tax=Acetobacterium paludosum TaxID=52693 RepID=A0A923KW32_9FIRM|nr:diguanylate cyclase [Acetobacterium paludosum]MBC3888065.1 diguanylate cyclase [Acetobacterium paludosum]